MGKTRGLFKRIRDTKGTFHAKMGIIKDINDMDLTEAEGIKKRWQEYTEKIYKKDLNDADNHNGVIIHLEPDILKCEVKWALGSPDWKRSVFIPIPKKGNAKECSNYYTIALTSHASKVMLKSLQMRLNSTRAKNFQMFKLDIEKAEEPETKLNHRKSKRIPEKCLLLLH